MCLNEQEVTRSHKDWYIEDVHLVSNVMREFQADIASHPAEGVYIHGLHLENAHWDRRGSKLVEARTRVGMTDDVIYLYIIFRPIVWHLNKKKNF